MATTTNYGWTTPNDTDLVRDGASAIRSLGSAIDTTVFNNANAAVQKTLVDAKGDLISASAADVPARLAVGNNGETLVADSSTSTGLRWQSAKAVNHVINGGQDFWQRGTSFSLTSGVPIYTADRFMALQGAGTSSTTVSRQTTSDTTNLPDIEYCARIQRNNLSTSTGILYYFSSFESAETRQLQGKPVVISFWARRGSGNLGSANTLTIDLRQGTGTDQNMTTGFTNETNVLVATPTLTTTWQRFQYTASVNTTTTQLGVRFYYQPTGTAGASEYFEVTGIQLELGSIASTFQRSGGTLGGELDACRRYYQRWTGSSANHLVNGLGPAYSTTAVAAQLLNVQPMRVTPTSIDYSSLKFDDSVNATIAFTALSIGSASTSRQVLLLGTGATGLTQYRTYQIIAANANDYLGISAEL